MWVTQGGTLVHHVGATLLWAPAPLRSTLQGLNQVFFLICHNQAMLEVGRSGTEPLDQVLDPRTPGPYLFILFLLPSWV